MTTNTTNSSELHRFVSGRFQFTLPVRYQELKSIGNGGFGAVIRAKDTETGKVVAIKKLIEPFTSPAHAQRTYRELKLLMYLNHPDAGVVQLYNVFAAEKSLKEFKTLYFVFNYAGFNLDQFIKTKGPFSEDVVKHIIYSILRGLKFMHSAGIIHRDLKPLNIGMNENADITILDFGLARLASNGVQTGYVATRWWRAPEVYVNWEQYDDRFDIWSVGCIMAELILLKVLFAGLDHIDQLHRIFNILGTPNTTTVHEICTKEPARYISGLPQKPKQDLSELFGFKYDAASRKRISGVSPQGVNLLDRMLSFDYRDRPSAAEALKHPFFKGLHDPEDEPTINRLTDVHQDADHTTDIWKSLVWQMMDEFKQPSWVNVNADQESEDTP